MNDLNPKVSWPILVVAAIIALGSVGFYFYKYYMKDIIVSTVSTETPVLADDEDINTWKTYESTDYSIEYPSNWVESKDQTDNSTIDSSVKFQPFESEENTNWQVVVYKGNKTDINRIIAELGAEYTDRKVTTDKIEFNSISATRTIITAPSYHGYYQVIVLTEKNDKIYAIINSKVKDSNFNSFYKSFKFK